MLWHLHHLLDYCFNRHKVPGVEFAVLGLLVPPCLRQTGYFRVQARFIIFPPATFC
jgi:hypothetical protein